MARRDLDVGRDDNGPRIGYNPATGEAFDAFRVPIPPELTDKKAVDGLRVAASLAVDTACSLADCGGRVRINTSGTLQIPAHRLVQSAILECGTIGCPLDNPPEFDGEPLTPSPSPPTLRATALTPVSEVL